MKRSKLLLIFLVSLVCLYPISPLSARRVRSSTRIINFQENPLEGTNIFNLPDGFLDSIYNEGGLFYLSLNEISRASLDIAEFLSNEDILNYYSERFLELFPRLRDQKYIEALRKFLAPFTSKAIITLEGFKQIEPILEGQGEYGELSPQERADRALRVYRESTIQRMKEDEDFKEVFDGDEEVLAKFLSSLTIDELALLEYAVYTPPSVQSVCKNREDKKSLIRIVRKIKERSGEGGLYEYLKSTDYYRAFKEKLKGMGVKEGFDTVGEHFGFDLQVKKRQYKIGDNGLEDFYPGVRVGDPKSLLIEFFQRLKSDEKLPQDVKEKVLNIFKKRGLGESEDEIIETLQGKSSEEIREELKEVIKDIMAEEDPNSKGNAEQLAKIVILLAEIYEAQKVEVKELQGGRKVKIDIEGLKMAITGDLDGALMAIKEYWSCIKSFFTHLPATEENKRRSNAIKKFYQNYVAGLINPKAEPDVVIEEELEEATSHFTVELSDRRWTDMYKGHVGDDCERDLHFYDTLGFLVDPAILLFKIYEQNGEGKKRWIGHMVVVIAQDKETGEPVLVVDIVQLGKRHWLNGKKSGEARKKFASEILDGLEKYARKFGFKKIVFAKNERNEKGEIKRGYISNRQAIAAAIEDKVSTRESSEDIQWELIPVGTAGERYQKLTASGIIVPEGPEFSARRFVGLPVGSPWRFRVEEDFGRIGHLNDFGFPIYYNTALQIFDLDPTYLPPEPSEP